MVDVLTKKQRSYNMSRIKGRDTKPEIKLRQTLFSRGLRGYRLSGLFGNPDIIYTKYKVAIFVDGCFWHKCPKHYQVPATRREFWIKKINGNVERDTHVNKILTEAGWKVLRFWEHDANRNLNKCYAKILRELVKRGHLHDN